MASNVPHLNKFISQVRVGVLLKRSFIDIDYFPIAKELLVILYREGYITGFYGREHEGKIRVFLKYIDNWPVIENIACYYRGGRQYSRTVLDFIHLNCKSGLFVFSTDLGLLTLKECLLHNVGGILLFRILP